MGLVNSSVFECGPTAYREPHSRHDTSVNRIPSGPQSLHSVDDDTVSGLERAVTTALVK